MQTTYGPPSRYALAITLLLLIPALLLRDYWVYGCAAAAGLTAIFLFAGQ